MHNIIVHQPQHDIATYQTSLFLDHVRMTSSASTLKTYTAKINGFMEWLRVQNTNKPLQAILESYRLHLSERYGSSRSKNLSLSIVRSLFKYLHEENIIEYNPALKLKNFKVSPGHSKTSLSKYQRHDLLQHIQTLRLRDRVLIHLLLSNGLRVNEVANIEITDISQRGENMVIYLLRKGYEDKSCHTILTAETYALIRELIGDRDSGYLFESNKGGGLSTCTISKLVKKILRDAGIDDPAITAHSLRHSTAILALQAGADIMQIKQMLNHKHLSSTQVYLESYERETNPAEKMFSIYD